MKEENYDLKQSDKVKQKKLEVVDGVTIKYHANGKTIWSKGRILDDQPAGYWEWYRADGTLKRSGYFEKKASLWANGSPMTAMAKNTRPQIGVYEKDF